MAGTVTVPLQPLFDKVFFDYSIAAPFTNLALQAGTRKAILRRYIRYFHPFIGLACFDCLILERESTDGRVY
jgi:hypothetical protein